MLGKKSYKDYAASHAPASHMAGNCARAFLFGGGICVLAQALCALYSMLGASEENARLCSTFTLIVLAALLTSLDVFDTIAEHAGAGTLVPITGFSNAISAEAISARSEGFITGIGNKIFTIAGPVILYGTAASVLYGIIYYIAGLFMLAVLCLTKHTDCVIIDGVRAVHAVGFCFRTAADRLLSYY